MDPSGSNLNAVGGLSKVASAPNLAQQQAAVTAALPAAAQQQQQQQQRQQQQQAVAMMHQQLMHGMTAVSGAVTG